jgi:hypothetical protein
MKSTEKSVLFFIYVIFIRKEITFQMHLFNLQTHLKGQMSRLRSLVIRVPIII